MKPDLDFSSLEEFRDVRQYISGRLHQVKRIWLSESAFVWEVAELMGKLGTTFEQSLEDPQTKAEFGDGYLQGQLPPDRRRARLLELLGKADRSW